MTGHPLPTGPLVEVCSQKPDGIITIIGKYFDFIFLFMFNPILNCDWWIIWWKIFVIKVLKHVNYLVLTYILTNTYLSHTVGWRPTYHSENLEKTIPTKVSAVLDTYRYAKVPGTKKRGGLPSPLGASAQYVPPKRRVCKSAILTAKKWFFGNSDTTFIITKFSRLHFVQISRNNSSTLNRSKSGFVDFAYG